MSFVTNAATRRGKKARTHGNSYQNILSSTGPAGIESVSRANGISGSARPPRRLQAVIGDHDSVGLTIQGGSAALEYTYPENPDDRDVPGGTSGQAPDRGQRDPATRVQDPAFPITFTGPGHLKFVQPLELPSVRGSLHVDGAVSWGDASSFDGSSINLADSNGNTFTRGTGPEITTAKIGPLVYISGEIWWTDKGTATGNMFIEGIPYSTAFAIGSVHPIVGVSPTVIGEMFHARGIGKEWSLLEAQSASSDDAIPVTADHFQDIGVVGFTLIFVTTD